MFLFMESSSMINIKIYTNSTIEFNDPNVLISSRTYELSPVFYNPPSSPPPSPNIPPPLPPPRLELPKYKAFMFSYLVNCTVMKNTITDKLGEFYMNTSTEIITIDTGCEDTLPLRVSRTVNPGESNVLSKRIRIPHPLYTISNASVINLATTFAVLLVNLSSTLTFENINSKICQTFNLEPCIDIWSYDYSLPSSNTTIESAATRLRRNLIHIWVIIFNLYHLELPTDYEFNSLEDDQLNSVISNVAPFVANDNKYIAVDCMNTTVGICELTNGFNEYLIGSLFDSHGIPSELVRGILHDLIFKSGTGNFYVQNAFALTTSLVLTIDAQKHIVGEPFTKYSLPANWYTGDPPCDTQCFTETWLTMYEKTLETYNIPGDLLDDKIQKIQPRSSKFMKQLKLTMPNATTTDDIYYTKYIVRSYLLDSVESRLSYVTNLNLRKLKCTRCTTFMRNGIIYDLSQIVNRDHTSCWSGISSDHSETECYISDINDNTFECRVDTNRCYQQDSPSLPPPPPPPMPPAEISYINVLYCDNCNFIPNAVQNCEIKYKDHVDIVINDVNFQLKSTNLSIATLTYHTSQTLSIPQIICERISFFTFEEQPDHNCDCPLFTCADQYCVPNLSDCLSRNGIDYCNNQTSFHNMNMISSISVFYRFYKNHTPDLCLNGTTVYRQIHGSTLFDISYREINGCIYNFISPEWIRNTHTFSSIESVTEDITSYFSITNLDDKYVNIQLLFVFYKIKEIIELHLDINLIMFDYVFFTEYAKNILNYPKAQGILSYENTIRLSESIINNLNRILSIQNRITASNHDLTELLKIFRDFNNQIFSWSYWPPPPPSPFLPPPLPPSPQLPPSPINPPSTPPVYPPMSPPPPIIRTKYSCSNSCFSYMSDRDSFNPYWQRDFQFSKFVQLFQSNISKLQNLFKGQALPRTLYKSNVELFSQLRLDASISSESIFLYYFGQYRVWIENSNYETRANNNICEDALSESNVENPCDIGGDCLDCGVRNESYTIGICTDSCVFANDGVCDEERTLQTDYRLLISQTGTANIPCDIHTDCTDCGGEFVENIPLVQCTASVAVTLTQCQQMSYELGKYFDHMNIEYGYCYLDSHIANYKEIYNSDQYNSKHSTILSIMKFSSNPKTCNDNICFC